MWQQLEFSFMRSFEDKENHIRSLCIPVGMNAHLWDEAMGAMLESLRRISTKLNLQVKIEPASHFVFK